MERVLAFLERAAEVDVPVLIVGETGTGKSHLAHLLHAKSARRAGPFVTVNCAGIPEGLFESELFGHRRGAFTGAVESRAGLFEAAHGGTLFLDEVGELPPTQQAKLLTVLEERRVRPVGGSAARAIDTRVVAATCRDLARAVEAGAFRADLYHRIALLRCTIPPLRRRPLDVEQLIGHLLRSLGHKYGRRIHLSDTARARLLGHPWPGNVRELAHTLEAAVILSGAQTLEAAHIEQVLTEPTAAGPARELPPAPETSPAPQPSRAPETPPEPDPAPGPSRYSFFGSEAEEREAIRSVLVRWRGNRTRTALELGMARNTLREKLRRYGLDD